MRRRPALRIAARAAGLLIGLIVRGLSTRRSPMATLEKRC
jgi:hypothetical protein